MPPRYTKALSKDSLIRFIETIKDQEERNIAQLIIAAIDNGIVIAERSMDLGNGYYQFAIEGEQTEYEIRFGKNPNRVKYPLCERATRASEFVTRLLAKIGTEYNFYVVPPSIEPPSAEAIKNRLFADATNVTVTRDKTLRNTKKAALVNKSRYEVEFVIDVQIGENYERITDSVVANETNIDDKITRKYEYIRTEHKELDPDNISNEDTRRAIAEASQTVARFLADIGGKDGAKSKNKILAVLAANEKSDFRAFLDKCVRNGVESGVGEINIYPSAIYVLASPEQTFRYKINLPRVQNGFGLEIICNAENNNEQMRELGKDVPMYIYSVGGEFKGLSFDSKSPDGRGTLEKLDADDKLVPVYKVVNGKASCAGITLTSDKIAASATAYKGVQDYAVLLDRSDNYSQNVHYYKSMTKYLDGKRVLTAEVGVCAYSGTEHFYKDLHDRWFVDDDGKMNSGLMYPNNASVMNYSCPTCKNGYYANSIQNIKYKSTHSLIDGSYYCDQCAKDLDLNKSFRFESEVYKDNPSQPGKLYARIDRNGVFTSLENGGNVYRCCHCAKLYYYDQSSVNAAHNGYKCKICGNHYCPSCNREKNKQVSGELIENIGQYRCSKCPSVEAPITMGPYAGQKIYSVYDRVGKKSKLIMAEAENPKTILKCEHCGYAVFVASDDEKKSCEVCSSPLCTYCDSQKSTLFKLANTGEPLCAACLNVKKYPKTISDVKKPVSLTKGKYRGMSILPARFSGKDESVLVVDNANVSNLVFECVNCKQKIYSGSDGDRSACPICQQSLCNKCVNEIAANEKKTVLLNDNSFFCKGCPPTEGKYIPYGAYAKSKFYRAVNMEGVEGYAVDDAVRAEHVFECSNCKQTVYDPTAKKSCEICGKRICSNCDKQNKKDREKADNLGKYFCRSCYDPQTKIIGAGDYAGKMVYHVRTSLSSKLVSIVDEQENPQTVFKCANCHTDVYRGNQSCFCDVCGQEICQYCKSTGVESNESVAALIGGKRTYTHVCNSCPLLGKVINCKNYPSGGKFYSAVVQRDDRDVSVKVFDDKADPELLIACKNCDQWIYESEDKNERAKHCVNCGDVLCVGCWSKSGVEDNEKWALVYNKETKDTRFCQPCRAKVTASTDDAARKKRLDLVLDLHNKKTAICKQERSFDDRWTSTVIQGIDKYIPHLNRADRIYLLRLKRKKNGELFKALRTVIVMRAVNDKDYCIRFILFVKHANGKENQYNFVENNGKVLLEN